MRALAAIFSLVALAQLSACGDRVVGFPVDDTTRPRVISTSPTDGADDVALYAPINATFSEMMDPTTIDADTFVLKRGDSPVAGAATFVGVTAIFTPHFALDPDAVYTALIMSDVTDLVGNQLATDYVWSFTRGAIVDTTPPLVTTTSPRFGADDVAINTVITATFSEPMRAPCRATRSQ